MGSLTNQILISMPHMADPYFSKAVVYVCEHNKEGAMGMIINKQFQAPDLKELFEKLYIGDDTIHSLVNDIFLAVLCYWSGELYFMMPPIILKEQSISPRVFP